MILVEHERKNTHRDDHVYIMLLYFLHIGFRNTSRQSNYLMNKEEGAMLHMEMGSEAQFFLNILTLHF
jgi:hypothetical protein